MLHCCQGSPSEQRVLVTTATTRVLPHTVPEEPALKKFKTGDSQLSGSSISQSNESTQKLVSYTVSSCTNVLCCGDVHCSP